MTGRRGGTTEWHTAVLMVAAVCVVALAGPARAQSPSPRPPMVEGEVEGSLAAGSTLAIAIDATVPGGWEGLHLVEAILRSGQRQLDRITYDIEDAQIAVGANRIVVGTGAAATGDFLRVGGADVVVTTGGAHLSLDVEADVLRAIPADVRFELSVTGDRGETARVVRRLAQPDDPGLTWATVVTAVAVALLAGGFVGNLFASRRRPPARLSVYGAIQGRIDRERSTPA